jgi:hypothetical protein
VASEESAWNTLWRIDHQLSNKHTWAFRWLRESAPQFGRLDGGQETLTSYGDETDLDQTLVGTLTSVLSDTKVNTVRYGLVLEDTVHANPAWRAQKPEYARCVPCPEGAGASIVESGPITTRRSTSSPTAWTIRYRRGTRSRHVLVVHSRREGPRSSFGARTSRIWRATGMGNLQDVSVPEHQGYRVDPANPRSYPCASRSAPDASTYEMIMHVGEFFAQDKWQIARLHAQRRRTVRPGSVSVRSCALGTRS